MSELCLGTTAFGTGMSAEESHRIWSRCIDAGVNFFDTADAVPESEELLGTLSRDQRHSLVISTKVFRRTGIGPNDIGLSRKHVVHACEASLRRLKTDYIDLYLAHSEDFLTPIEETLSAFDQLVRQGKVLYNGASNHIAWRLNEALWIALTHNYSRYCCVQAQYNLQKRDIEGELLPMCEQKSIGVVAWSPLAHGALTDAVAKEAGNADGRHDAALARQDGCSALAEEPRGYRSPWRRWRCGGRSAVPASMGWLSGRRRYDRSKRIWALPICRWRPNTWRSSMPSRRRAGLIRPILSPSRARYEVPVDPGRDSLDPLRTRKKPGIETRNTSLAKRMHGP